uniref:Phosphoglucosamine mutase n=1 Tax=Candidatus Methanogaster sp. ANME-2c ERB4 TaxID=2759911 RepID=A0A7G9YLA8_9EURY|nr:phosphoglucosamine mutase [Methanosarcinales archaeon ANME-2c ERB4]
MKFGSSGIRGIANQAVTSELALRIGRGVGTGKDKVVVGHDTRRAAEMIEYAAISGLLSVGCRVTRVGMVATPTLAYVARDYDCGIMVTASHNPPEYVGVKLFNPDGMAFDSKQQKMIERLIGETGDADVKLASWDRMHPVRTDENAVSNHISKILASVMIEKRMRVVVDCGCGAASLTTPYLLRAMGCDVVTLNSQPDGFFPGHNPEPKSETLTALQSVVLRTNSDLGIAHDGDADRMVAVDDQGEVVSNDKLLAFFGMHEARKKMVVPVDTSMLIDAVLPDIEIIRTRVGDVFIAEEMKRTGADFGGEPSGTWIFPRVSYCPEGIYSAARLVELLSREDVRFSDHLSPMPEYEIKRGSIPYSGDLDDRRIEEELHSLPSSDVSTIDGIRLGFDDAWALIRPSGTEPLIRITVEGATSEVVEKLYREIQKIVKGAIDESSDPRSR